MVYTTQSTKNEKTTYLRSFVNYLKDEKNSVITCTFEVVGFNGVANEVLVELHLRTKLNQEIFKVVHVL